MTSRRCPTCKGNRPTYAMNLTANLLTHGLVTVPAAAIVVTNDLPPGLRWWLAAGVVFTMLVTVVSSARPDHDL